MNKCLICSQISVKKVLDLGKQPVTNQYWVSGQEAKKAYSHSLVLGVCIKCGLLQQCDLFPIKQISPKQPFAIKYSEPEDHLDSLSVQLLNLFNTPKNIKIFGVSYKDETLLARLAKWGFQTTLLSPFGDLGIEGISGVESIQSKLDRKKISHIIKKYGRQDLIIARHILEHVYDVEEFIFTLKGLLNPNGYILLEVPGCQETISLCDYTTVWEEHTMYFTPETFKGIFSRFRLKILKYEEVSYPLEKSLIVLCKLDNALHFRLLEEKKLSFELQNAIYFGEKFIAKKNHIIEFLKKHKHNVLFGAGHLSCCYINFFNLKEYFECFIDDSIDKVGLYMSGCGLPIYHSDKLLNKKGVYCFLGLNPRNESKVVVKNSNIIKNKGKFFSIFPSSKYRII